MPLPTVSLTDHTMYSYSHNIVVQYIDSKLTHKLEYCTHVNDPHKPEHDIIRTRLYNTLALLGPDTNDYVLVEVTWTNDF